MERQADRVREGERQGDRPRQAGSGEIMTFKGFERPEQNYSKLPHSFIDVLPQIDTMAEMKVVLYLLRHTWGFSEFGKPKKLTTDEFCNGRKKKDQSRMDNGTGLSENSVRSGLEKAIEHGFILVEIDETDKARIEKWYCLNMEDSSNFEARGANFEDRSAEFEDRSEKETKERKDHGTNVPNTSEYPIDWQLANGGQVSQPDQFKAQIRDAANSMDMGAAGAGALAFAFMAARNIVIPEGKIKGNRKAAREMLEMHVKPEHVRQATLELVDKGMTVTDLFSVSKTAIDLANKPAEKEYIIQPTEIEDWRKQIKL